MLWLLAAAISAFILIYRIWKVLPGIHPKKRKTDKRLHIMVVLGSGGHTGEMMPIVSRLGQWKHMEKMTVIAANTDNLSLSHKSIPDNAVKETIPRAREVGQSYFTSIFSTMKAVFSGLKFMFAKPDLLLVNGPGVCCPIVFAIFLGNVLGITNASIVFIESFCRVTTLSLTGRLIYPMCDLFFVHWPGLVKLRKRAKLVDQFGLFKNTKTE